MAPTQTQPQQLAVLLSGEIACARDLLQILGREYQALTHAEADQIESLSAEKRRQMQQLQQRLLERDRFLLRQGLAPAKQGMEQLLKQASPLHDIHSLWEELQALAGRLREQNEINGGIVSLGQRHVQQALDLLTGRSSNGDTYGPAGGHRSAPVAQTLAKA